MAADQESLGATAQRDFRRAVLAVVAASLLFAMWVVFKIGGEEVTQYFDDLSLVAAPLVATIACYRAARREAGRARRAWMLLAASTLAWTLGQTAWSYYELVLGQEVPFPSVADIGYLAMVPLAAAAMLSFPTGAMSVTLQARTLLDGLIIGGSLLFVSWAVLLGPLYRAGSGTVLEEAIGLAYPAGDVVVAGIVLFVAIRARPRQRLPLVLLGGGLVCLAIADSGFSYLTLIEAYATGNVIDIGWFVGFLLIALAALRPWTEEGSESGEERTMPTRLGALLPFFAVFVCAVVAAVKQVQDGHLERFLFWNIFVVIILVATRQLITLFENLALTDALETKVRARTADLEEAIHHTEQAQKLQDAFVASVSHELRTPLTTMTGAASTLLRPELDAGPEVRALAEMYARNADHMARLVEDLLVATGIGEQIQCARSPFDLSKASRSALRLFAPKDKELSIHIPDSLVAIGDAERLPTLLGHLLSNADKFAPAGTTIFVETGARDGFVKLVVRDEGPGVPAHLREAIFDRFYQVDGSLTRERGGMGLGLFIARRLAEGMGGRLTVDDAPSGGAAFRLVLPTPSTETVAGTTAHGSGEARAR